MTKKKKQSISPRVSPTPASTLDFGEIEFIPFLSIHVIGYDSLAMENERLHLFEPPW